MLSACQTAPPPDLDARVLLDNTNFQQSSLVRIETKEEVFALNDDAKKFVDNVLKREDDPFDAMEQLSEAIFARSELGLLYEGHANYTAAETFQQRAANCLSLSIMAFSMAEYAGFSVRFQKIDIPEFWTRREGYSFINGHVNLSIKPNPHSKYASDVTRLVVHSDYVLDFDRRRSSGSNLRKQFIDKDTVMAMFYNNKAVDALVKNDYVKTYAYLSAALNQDPQFSPAIVNLGVFYRLNGNYQLAEKSYQTALRINNEDYTAWENLALLYKASGNDEIYETIIARIKKVRTDNPNYQLILGEEAFDNGEFERAISYYKKALKLERSQHQAYFGLAKSYYELGDKSLSEKYFKRAAKTSNSYQDRERYTTKLDFLLRS